MKKDMNIDPIKRAKQTLSEQLKMLDKVKTKSWLNLEIDSLDFRTDEDIKEVCKRIIEHSAPVIYRIYLSSTDEQKALVSNYLSFQELNKKKQRGIDRYNTSRFNGGESLTLYVGSSSNFKSRLERHLGRGSIRTFALKLNKWDNSLNYRLKVDVFTVESLNGESISQDILELIEQEVWEMNQPVFGKRSGK